jgi:hypothetical protein
MEPKSAEEAMAMVQAGLQALIQNAPSPEVGQQLEQALQAIAQVVQGAQSSAEQPSTPEQGANPNARPMGA